MKHAKEGPRETAKRARRGQIYVSLPNWVADELRDRVAKERDENLDATLSGLVRRFVLQALKAEGVHPPN